MDGGISFDLYLSAESSSTNSLLVSVYTAIVLLVYKFCRLDCRLAKLHFVQETLLSSSREKCVVELDSRQLGGDVDRIADDSVPLLVKNCALPVAVCRQEHLVISGLCSVLRFIVRAGQQNSGQKPASSDALILCRSVDILLGQRYNCLRACSEVSAWTKYAEVSLPAASERFLSGTVDQKGVPPDEVMQLENHLSQPVVSAGSRYAKKKRPTLVARNSSGRLKPVHHQKENEMENRVLPEIGQTVAPVSSTELVLSENGTQEVKTTSDELGKSYLTDLSVNDDVGAADEKCYFVESEFLQLTDLILFLCVGLIFNAVHLHDWLKPCRRVFTWYRLVVSLPRVREAVVDAGLSGYPVLVNSSIIDNLVKESSSSGSLLSSSLNCNSDPPAASSDQNSATGGRLDISLLDGKKFIRNPNKKKFKAAQTAVTAACQMVLDAGLLYKVLQYSSRQLPWQQFPSWVLPTREGGVPDKRADRKLQQLENLAAAVLELVGRRKSPGVIVDFCSGGGHLGILLAFLLPDYKVVLVENKEESVRRAMDRVKNVECSNVTVLQCNLGCFQMTFDIGVCLHACGVSTDLVMQKCIKSRASFVICPCCYGAICDTHSVTYPRSRAFQNAGMSYDGYLALGHAADQTQETILKAEQGRMCMACIDSDRACLAREGGYEVGVYVMSPPACSPKNHLLIGCIPD